MTATKPAKRIINLPMPEKMEPWKVPEKVEEPVKVEVRRK